LTYVKERGAQAGAHPQFLAEAMPNSEPEESLAEHRMFV